MRFINNKELEANKAEEERLVEITEQEAKSPIKDSMIATYIKHCFDSARRYKEQGVEQRILENMRQIDGQYSPDKLAQIRKIGGSEVFMMITDAKCKNAGYWVQDILFQPGQKSWGIDPTPIPELPDEAKNYIASSVFNKLMESISQEVAASGVLPDAKYIEERVASAMPDIEKAIKEEIIYTAKEKAKNVEQNIDDKLTEGGWYSALRKVIPNVIMHTGFLKGPINKKRKITKVITGPNGQLTKQVFDDIYPTWESRHPLYIYPAPGSTDVDDGYLIDRVKMTPIALQELLGIDGYNDDEILAVLDEYEGGKLYEWLPVDQDIADLNEEEGTSYDSDKIDCLEFWGAVRGSYLVDWGLSLDYDGNPIEEMLFYHIKAYLIGTHVIGIQYNDDPAGKKPYYKDSFENKDGSFWGKGLPEIISDVQQVCNSVARAIANNAAMACLTGDTVVYRQHANRRYGTLTLDELWKKKHQYKNGLKRLKLRALNEDTGEFFGNRIIDIFDNGIQEIFNVTTEAGYKIRATRTHRFMNDAREWQVLDDFDVGDLIAVNGQNDSFGDAYLRRYLSYDRIVSIEYAGEERVFDLQMNAPYHNFIANGFVSHNSGPQCERNIDRIPAYARDDDTLTPWKVWDSTSDMMSTGPAISFFQPPMVVERLLSVYAAFNKIADEHSGVPGFAHGDPQVGGAGNTATGLNMLMGAAARGIRGLVSSIDENIIKPSIERQYFYIVDSEPNYGFVCDYQIVTSGSAAALVKEQMAARRIEFMNATANPIDAQIIGIEGRKYLLEETARSIQLDLRRVFPVSTPPLVNANPPPPEKPMQTDVSGNPVVGQDVRQFNEPSAQTQGG